MKLSESNIINIPEYINQYLETCRNIHRDITFVVNNKQNVRIARACSLLDISLIIDNLISNSKKVNATTIQIDILKDSGKQIIDFSDSGEGVPQALVNNPDKVSVERKIDEKGVLLSLTVDPEDVGRVIGKRGVTAQSSRMLLRALGTKQDARYNLKIVNTDEDGEPFHESHRDEKRQNQHEEEKEVEAVEVEDVEEDEGSDEEYNDESETSELAEKTRAELADLDDLDI